MLPRCPLAINSSKGWICPMAQSQQSSTGRAEGSYPHLKLWWGCWTWHAGHVQYPRSLCPWDQWWPNCWVWRGTFPETLRMGGGQWPSEVGTSVLDHADYILANKLNVPWAVLWRWSLRAGMVYAHSALLPSIRVIASKITRCALTPSPCRGIIWDTDTWHNQNHTKDFSNYLKVWTVKFQCQNINKDFLMQTGADHWVSGCCCPCLMVPESLAGQWVVLRAVHHHCVFPLLVCVLLCSCTYDFAFLSSAFRCINEGGTRQGEDSTPATGCWCWWDRLSAGIPMGLRRWP